MDCLFRDCVSTCSGEKSEHLLQRCIGGSLESPDVTCADCNEFFGEELEPEMAAWFEPLMETLGPLMSGRLSSRVLKQKSLDGDVNVIRTGGVTEVRGVYVITDDNGQVTEIFGHRRDQVLARARALGLPESSFKFSIVPPDELLKEGMTGSRVLFGHPTRRSVAKTLLATLDHFARASGRPPYARSDQLRDARVFARVGTYQGFIDERLSPMLPLSDELDNIFGSATAMTFQNRVVICNDPTADRCFGLLQVGNTMPLGMCLGGSVDPNPFSMLYEKQLVVDGSAPREEWLNDAVLRWSDMKWAAFHGGTVASLEFAFQKMAQSRDEQVGRARFVVDLMSDPEILVGIQTHAHDLVVNKAVGNDALLGRIIRAVLYDRYRYASVSPERWESLATVRDSNVDAVKLRDNIANRDELGDQAGAVLTAVRAELRNMQREYGYPVAMKVIRHGIGPTPSP